MCANINIDITTIVIIWGYIQMQSNTIYRDSAVKDAENTSWKKYISRVQRLLVELLK